jgi:predicted protein tyrosine phosphatase
MSHHDHPIPDSYWVATGRFLAGEYPGAPSQDDAIAKLNQLLDAGVTHFIDLTEAGEYGLLPYADLAQQIGRLRGCKITHQRMPIRDMSAPSATTMRTILDAVDAAINQGETIYVHCFGGIGRTGTVVGCYLVQQGMSGEKALAEIARRRADTPDGWRRSPETDAQQELVRSWGVTGDR